MAVPFAKNCKSENTYVNAQTTGVATAELPQLGIVSVGPQ